MKVALHTFGCKLNQAEGQKIVAKLIEQNYRIVPIKERADYYLINACAVTAKAEKEVRQLINQIKRREPKSFLIVTGCYLSQENPKVDLWTKKEGLIRFLGNQAIRKSDRIRNSARFVIGRNETSKTRSFVKIQDGCHRFCTYCLVPYLRGKPKSKSLKKIIQEIKEKEMGGYQEVVLVGVDIGQYQEHGRFAPSSPTNYEFSRITNRFRNNLEISIQQQIDLILLIREILNKTSIPRIRLSSLWPTDITSELIDLFRDSRLCPHLHISLQSGSNRILKLMGRNYTRGKVKKIIKRTKKIPNLNLTADIIVGFPDERDKDFQATYKFIKLIGFSRLHVFRYSARPLTLASSFSHQVARSVRKRRSQKLIKLADQLNKKFRQGFIGNEFLVLFEQLKGDYWTGLTNNYLKVYTKSREDLQNQIRLVKLRKIFKDGISAILVNF